MKKILSLLFALTGSLALTQLNAQTKINDGTGHPNAPLTDLISGHVYNDVNGLTDNTVNGAAYVGSTHLNALLYDNSTGSVAAVSTVSSGSYSFNATSGDDFTVYLTTNTATVGSATVPTVALPTGWVSTGENLGAGVGSDGTANSILPIGILSANVTNVNFGIEQTPTAAAKTGTTQQNPGGNAVVTLPTLTGSDPEQGTFSGTSLLDTVIINTLPPNGTMYYNGVPISTGDTIKKYNPALLTLDPSDGVSSVAFTYSEVDAALVSSSPATVTMPFTTAVAFSCGSQVYQVSSPSNTNSSLYSYNVNTATRVLIAVLGYSVNALGYNPADNLLWGINTTNVGGLVRIDANGAAIQFSVPNFASANSNGAGPSNAGAFLAGGYYVIQNGGNNAYWTLDLNPMHNTYLQLVDPLNNFALKTAAPYYTAMVSGSLNTSDFAYSTANGLLYGVDYMNSKIFRFNALTATVTEYSTATTPNIASSGASGGTALSSNGILINYDDNSGIFWGIDTATNTAKRLSTTTAQSNTDGASCFTALLTVTLSGNVYDDANGLTDNTVNGTAYAGTTALNAVLYDNSTGMVASVSTVSAGAYSLNATPGDSYTVYLTTGTATVGSATTPTVAVPTGWVSTGENLGSGTGSDGTVNGVLPIGVLSANTTNANFAIEQKPTGTAETAASQLNPGTGVAASVPLTTSSSANVYQAKDVEDGTYTNNLTGKTVLLNVATNGTLYYNGVAVTSATTITNFSPAKVSMAPTSAGTVNSTFTYQVYDNANVASATITVTVPFTAPVRTITGMVWNDVNFDAINTGESFTNAGGVYAVLVNSSGVVVQSVLVNASTGAYSFGVSTSGTYKVILSGINQTKGSTLTAATLPPGWANTGVNINGTASTVNETGIISVTYSGANIANQNFGVVQCPNGLNIATNASSLLVCASSPLSVNLTSTPSGGKTPYASYLWGGNGVAAATTQNTSATPTATTTYTVTVTDALGCTASANTTVTVDQSMPSIALTCGTNSNGINYAQLVENSGIATTWLWATTSGGRFYPDNTLSANNDAPTSTLQAPYIDFNGTYTVTVTDANGCSGSGQATLDSSSCNVILAINNLSFTVEKQDNTAVLNWSTASETNNSYFNVERSNNGVNWQVIGRVRGQGNSTFLSKYSFADALPLNGTNYYRLKQVDVNGQSNYSQVRSLVFTAQWVVKLYPNPVQNYLVLEFNNAKDEKANIVIQNVLGSNVFATEQQLVKGLNRIVLDQVRQLAGGTYLLTMGTTENVFHSKFVKGVN